MESKFFTHIEVFAMRIADCIHSNAKIKFHYDLATIVINRAIYS